MGAAALLLFGCSGNISEGVPGSGPRPAGSVADGDLPGSAAGDGDGDGADGSGTPGSDSPGSSSPGAPDPFDPDAVPSDFGPEDPAPAPRMVRLTHEQWMNAVRDLLMLEEELELPEFRPDPLQGGFLFDNDATSLQVDESLWNGYQRAAVTLAELVAGDPARLARIAPPGSDDASTGAETFIRGFGQRAHRRPLTDEQVGDYLALHTQAATLFPDSSAYEGGVELLLQAFLQSPHFLYRIEESTEEVGGVIPLDDWEIASKLSFTLWKTMPDDALFTAAAAGELRDATMLREQVARMIDDPRLARVTGSFHAQLLEVEKFASISPASGVYDTPDDLPALALSEHERFLEDLVFEQNGGYRELLTSTRTFVNDDLAAIYGLSGSYGDELVEAELDPSQRRGIFTQVGFLATNASSVDPDPIHRGVFLAKRIACLHIAAPNEASPPIAAMDGRTNREVIEEQTEVPGTACAGCHSGLINPFGFPFESYDATGAHRTEDNGYPVDTSASPLIGGSPVMVGDALEMLDAMADSPAVHECYVKHWLEFLHGRPESDQDASIEGRLGDGSVQGQLSIKDLLGEVVTSPSFLTRATEELP